MRDKTIEQALDQIRSTNAWHLWRQVPPDLLFDEFLIRQEVRDRAKSALAAGSWSYPELAGVVQEFGTNRHESLFRFLLGLPADIDEGEFAWFDMRMTAALAAGLSDIDNGQPLSTSLRRPSSGWGRRFGLPGNPFAAGMLSRGLTHYAKCLPQPACVRNSVPRRDRTDDETAEVMAWKREKKQLFQAALGWLKCDPLATVFDVNTRRLDLSVYEELAGVLDTVSNSDSWYAKRKDANKVEDPIDDFFDLGDRTASAEKDAQSAPQPEIPQLLVLKEKPKLKGDLSKQGWERLAELLPLLGTDPGELIDCLASEFPWMTDAVNHVRLDLNLRRFADNSGEVLRIRPLLLVGPPGTGKTRFARRMAELAGVPLRIVKCGGSSDNRDLEGTARGWSSAEPSAVLRAIRDDQCANPVILVDEVEKAGESRHNGRIIDTLLTMLEPESSQAWYDECLCMAADLTAVNWILTANKLQGLTEPLLNRVTIVRVPEPPVELLPRILESLKAEIAREMGVHPFALPEILPEAAMAIRDAFAKHASIRRIKAALLSAIGASLSIPRTLH